MTSAMSYSPHPQGQCSCVASTAPLAQPGPTWPNLAPCTPRAWLKGATCRTSAAVPIPGRCTHGYHGYGFS